MRRRPSGTRSPTSDPGHELMSRIQEREAIPSQLKRQLVECILEEDAASPGGNGTGGVA